MGRAWGDLGLRRRPPFPPPCPLPLPPPPGPLLALLSAFSSQNTGYCKIHILAESEIGLCSGKNRPVCRRVLAGLIVDPPQGARAWMSCVWIPLGK